VWLCVASSVSGITRDYLLWVKQSKIGLDSEPEGGRNGGGGNAIFCPIVSGCWELS